MDACVDRKAAVFVTRDGYLSTMFVDVRQAKLEVVIDSMDLARRGQALTFRRQGPAGVHISLYEEVVEATEPG